MRPYPAWEIECDLGDGARIGRLAYHGVELLTARPPAFAPPRQALGRYETRPVYGHDECFPTVDACDGWPDHGELCWLPWEGSVECCWVHSRRWPLKLTRTLEFSARRLGWTYTVENSGDRPRSFQHVMHSLMPLGEIAALTLPAHRKVFDERVGAIVELGDPAGFLLAQPLGAVQMLLLQQLAEGRLEVRLRRGPAITVRFSPAQFPTLGIWWNHLGYPAEDGLRRSECAFEPLPGPGSSLTTGSTLCAPPCGTVTWTIAWEMT